MAFLALHRHRSHLRIIGNVDHLTLGMVILYGLEALEYHHVRHRTLQIVLNNNLKLRHLEHVNLYEKLSLFHVLHQEYLEIKEC